MKRLQERLKTVEEHIKAGKICIMIIGLGSVGTYLLDYLISRGDPSIRIVVVGRNREKMERHVNIVKVAGLIRQVNRSHIEIEAGVDLEDIHGIKNVIMKYSPDFIVNSSRAYPGLKYGSISWSNIRAYGIWSPLAIRFMRNIMESWEKANSDSIVINTSYSDAVIPWLKSAGMPYPDFGSGNLNHLVPRIQLAAAKMLNIEDFWNIEVLFAAGHFHDVCISKEGQTEGVEIPLKIYYKGEEKELSHKELYSACKITMPVDTQRNMMNASSNCRIITAVIEAVRNHRTERVFIPGAFGKLGGYPVMVGYRDERLDAWIDESVFCLEEMDKVNRKSMALDGVEDIRIGTLYYTDELIEKTKKTFGVELPKYVTFEEIDKTAEYLIEKIIIPQIKVK